MTFELSQVGSNTYYIRNTTNIGIYRCEDNGIYIIDTGVDDEVAEEILAVIRKQNWHVKAIINTHSNADHIGGNDYIQQKTGCPVFAYGMEAVFTRYPVIDPSFLYGGYPCRELRSKFFLAKGSEVTEFSSPNFPKIFEIIPLPGHYFDMVGLRTPDDVVFLADSLVSERTLKKLGITFIYDVRAYLDTLKKLEDLKAAFFVPAHVEPTDEIRSLAKLNQEKVMEIAQIVKTFCKTPRIFDDVLKHIFDTYHLRISFQQYVLAGSTVRSFLAWMKDEGVLDVTFKNNRMLWVAR